MKPSNRRTHVRQLCCLGLPSEQLMPSLLKAVRQLVGADSAGFFWVDAQGDMTNLYAERLLPAAVILKFVDALSGLGLSPKQREVALGLAKGSSNREIAAAMGVSVNTVAYHIKQLFQRLDAHDRQQMIAKILLDGVQLP